MKSARDKFFYSDDDGLLVAMRQGDYKYGFAEQRSPGTMQVWAEPFTKLRLQKIYNLFQDPFERADITSNTFWDWQLNHVGASTARWTRSSSSRRHSRSSRRARSRLASTRRRSWKRPSTTSGTRKSEPRNRRKQTNSSSDRASVEKAGERFRAGQGLGVFGPQGLVEAGQGLSEEDLGLLVSAEGDQPHRKVVQGQRGCGRSRRLPGGQAPGPVGRSAKHRATDAAYVGSESGRLKVKRIELRDAHEGLVVIGGDLARLDTGLDFQADLGLRPLWLAAILSDPDLMPVWSLAPPLACASLWLTVILADLIPVLTLIAHLPS